MRLTSTRKALNMPTKDWVEIQLNIDSMWLGKGLEVRTESSSKIDAVLAALTTYLYLQGQTESAGDEMEVA